jgi:ABC-type phosphate/phosphonate transport system substrate-binding protein
MIASLPMYDWPEVRDATDRFWRVLSRHLGVEVPLWRGENHVLPWQRPDLLFSQTCGYPYTHEFRGRLTYVATPHYDVAGCDGPHYSSTVFARSLVPLEAFRGSKAAVNSRDSMSGMLALQLVFAPLARQGIFFSDTVLTGSHIASLDAVRLGKADVCAVDAVCVAMAKRYRPELLKGLVEIAKSPLVAGLPFVTVAADVETLRRGLQSVMEDPALAETCKRLFLSNYSVINRTHYDRILELESAMQNAGGMHL